MRLACLEAAGALLESGVGDANANKAFAAEMHARLGSDGQATVRHKATTLANYL